MMGLNEQSKNPLGFISDPNYMDYSKFNYNSKEKEINNNNDQPKNITIDWIDSFDKIKDKSKKIFLYLTARSCSICRVIEKEFFNTKEFYDFYNLGFNHFQDGDWLKAKIYFEKANDVLGDKDGPTENLIRIMKENNFTRPADWKGNTAEHGH